MQPVLKGFDCVEHDPIDQWEPRDPAEVNFSLCMHIGIDGEPGADLFYVKILLEEAVRALPGKEIKQMKKLVLPNYSWSAVIDAIQQILDAIDHEDWNSISDQLRQYFDWEYEGIT